MARTRARDSKGRFLKRARTRRTTTTRRRAPASRQAAPRRKTARRRSYRRNPPMIANLRRCAVGAGMVIAGEVGVRTLPRFLPGIPTTGALGIAVRTVLALGIGMVAGRVTTKANADLITIGALTVPLRDILVAANIPGVSAAVQPQGLAGYVQYPRMSGGAGTRPTLGAGMYAQGQLPPRTYVPAAVSSMYGYTA